MKSFPDFDRKSGAGLDALGNVIQCVAGDAGLAGTADGIRLTVRSGDATHYSNAEMDNYRRLPRRVFPNRPPLTLSVRARFSAERATTRDGPGLLGTAGFGFWNDPFAMSGARVPMLPRAAWFFYASPPSDMKLDHDTPGWGWKAGAMDTLRPAALPAALSAPVLVPLMRSRQDLRPGLAADSEAAPHPRSAGSRSHDRVARLSPRVGQDTRPLLRRRRACPRRAGAPGSPRVCHLVR